MHFAAAFISVAALHFAGVQAQDVSAQVASIVAQFAAAGLTPSPLATFAPTAVLDVTWDSVALVAGQPFTIDQVKPQPTITYTPATTSNATTFTVAMIDADIVGADQSAGQTRHWLLNSVPLAGTSLDLASTDIVGITTYGGPYPAEGSGPHRYVILVLEQTDAFTPPSTPPAGSPIETFDFNAYVTAANLGPIVAGTYYTVERGTATVSLVPTSAVAAPTSGAAQSTGSAAGSVTGTGTKSGSLSPSATKSSTATTAAASNGASSQAVQWSLLGFAGLMGVVAW